MLVRERMTRRIVAAHLDDGVAHAAELMARHGIRHLPVLRAGRLIGILSDRDLRGVRDAAKSVRDIMTLNPIAISPDAAVDDAAPVMQTHKTNALPVVAHGRVVGILTSTGILGAFIDLSGAAEPTTRIVLTSKNGRGTERTVRHIVQSCHAELKWIHRRGS